jgi:hypothetical protein
VNEIVFNIIFGALSLLFFLISRWMRMRWSGMGFTLGRFKIAITYNILLIIFHLTFSETGEILLIGKYDNSVMGWISLALVFLHGFSIPNEYDYKPWFRRKTGRKT